MPEPGARTLSLEEARTFYDRFGARQDRQGFYEHKALEVLLDHGRFGAATVVVELGCGTGRFAERLLAEYLPAAARYSGYDLSATMVSLSRRRLERFAPRAQVAQSDGSLALPLETASCDRFVSNYVADLLSEGQVRQLVGEAGRLLEPGGLLGLVSLTGGASLRSRLLVRLWRLVHRLQPRLVGGCRPLELAPFLQVPGFTLLHHSKVVAWAIPSEVVVAKRGG